MCRIILTYETAAARSVVAQKRGFPAVARHQAKAALESLR